MKKPAQALVADIVLISFMVICSFLNEQQGPLAHSNSYTTFDTSSSAEKSTIINPAIPLNIYTHNAKHPVFSGTTGSLGIGNTYNSLQSLLHVYEFGNNNNNNIISMVMKTMQYQQKVIDSLKTATKKQIQINQDSINKVLVNQNTLLKNQIDNLTGALNACCTAKSTLQNNNSSDSLNNSTVDSRIDINLQDLKTPQLGQNAPNPFSNLTTITYFIPDSIAQAQIVIYNMQGKVIQTVDLNQRGKGSIYINAQDLMSGFYNYTLIIDGRSIGFKKMERQ